MLISLTHERRRVPIVYRAGQLPREARRKTGGGRQGCDLRAARQRVEPHQERHVGVPRAPRRRRGSSRPSLYASPYRTDAHPIPHPTPFPTPFPLPPSISCSEAAACCPTNPSCPHVEAHPRQVFARTPLADGFRAQGRDEQARPKPLVCPLSTGPPVGGQQRARRAPRRDARRGGRGRAQEELAKRREAANQGKQLKGVRPLKPYAFGDLSPPPPGIDELPGNQ
jgi:hypothetical protein